MPGELFSTWLARAALAQGCDPMHLTGSLWPRWRAWTVDLDRGLRADRMAALATRSGLDAVRLEAAMLRPVLAAVSPDVDPAQANWPWVLSLGSRNRRRQGGLQFCPRCLADDAAPHFRRAWRLAWHVGCARHGVLLSDHCGYCHGPVEPHRARARDVTPCRCPSCGHDLRETVTDVACADALAFQSAADEVLTCGHGTWSGAVVSRDAWFGLAKQYASGRILARREDATMPGLTALPLNLQRPSERALRSRMALRGMHGQPRGEPMLARRNIAMSHRPATVSGGSQGGHLHHPAPARPRAKVQGEWIRLLRRLRIGHP